MMQEHANSENPAPNASRKRGKYGRSAFNGRSPLSDTHITFSSAADERHVDFYESKVLSRKDESGAHPPFPPEE